MITNAKLAQIVQRVEHQEINGHLLSHLRRVYPELHFTYCLDTDVIEEVPPVEKRSAFNVYLVDGREHCLRLTTDHNIATGVVLAAVMDEDDS